MRLNSQVKLFNQLAMPLVKLLDDESVTEIYIDDWNNISYMVKGLLLKHDNNFENEDRFISFCEHVIKDATSSSNNEFFSENTAPDHRVSVYFPNNSRQKIHSFATLRLHRKSPLTSKDLIGFGMISKEDYDKLLQSILEGKNILISGKTNSGKTTLLRCLLTDYLVLKKGVLRVGLLEDPAELDIYFEYGFRIELNQGDVDAPAKAMEHILRHSPQLVVIGELIKPMIALTFVRAIEAGFSGTISTIHAHNASVTRSRLASLASDSSKMSRNELLEISKDAIDVVVHVGFDFESGIRKVEEIIYKD